MYSLSSFFFFIFSAIFLILLFCTSHYHQGLCSGPKQTIIDQYLYCLKQNKILRLGQAKELFNYNVFFTFFMEKYNLHRIFIAQSEAVGSGSPTVSYNGPLTHALRLRYPEISL